VEGEEQAFREFVETIPYVAERCKTFLEPSAIDPSITIPSLTYTVEIGWRCRQTSCSGHSASRYQHGAFLRKAFRGLCCVYGSRKKEKRNEKLRAIGHELKISLSSIHDKGYCHNDISPSNVMYNESTEKSFLI
jgi:serine/threonine protein kinase